MTTEQRFKVVVTLEVLDSKTGDKFSKTEQTWESMGYESLVGVEKILHSAQGELLAWAEESIV